MIIPLFTKVVARPQGSTTSDITLKLPAVRVYIDILAKPDYDGSGTALASGVLDFTVTSGNNPPRAITLESSITRIEAVVSGVSTTKPFIEVAPGQSVNITAQAYNTVNALVLVDASCWQWELPVETVGASLSATTGSSVACMTEATFEEDASISLRETESGRETMVSIYREDQLAGINGSTDRRKYIWAPPGGWMTYLVKEEAGGSSFQIGAKQATGGYLYRREFSYGGIDLTSSTAYYPNRVTGSFTDTDGSGYITVAWNRNNGYTLEYYYTFNEAQSRPDIGTFNRITETTSW